MFFPRWFAKKNRKPIITHRPRFAPHVELLETRDLPTALLVTTTADIGSGSLRDAILRSNADGGGDQIYFNIGGGVQTITLQSALPIITAPVTIDGYSQGAETPHNLATPNALGAGKGTNANLSVQLTGVSSVTVGLDVAASGTVIRGLSIYGFSQAGILTEFGAKGVTVAGDFLGVTALGGLPPSKNGVGVQVNVGSTGNIIGTTAVADRNLISGNAKQGILLLGDSNALVNDLIGTDKLGSGAIANDGQGVLVQSSGNTIGGTSAAERNIISGNATRGVEILNAANNQVLGNYIGTSANGLSPDGNQQAGVLLNTDGTGTLISGNLISANDTSGNPVYGGLVIGVGGGGLANNNVIVGNTIGLAANGKPLGNTTAGVLVGSTNVGTIIGGTTLAARNVIAGNKGDGVAITAGASAVVVQGNFIGVTGPNGATPVANTGNGVRISGGSATIGGILPGQSNIISGNAGAGILVNSQGTATIQGNFIGLGADGSAIGNGKQGVFLAQDKGSTVGGTTSTAGNVISANKANAVDILNGTSNDVIQGNRIGTNATGNGAVGNGGVGVLVNASTGVTVGGTADGAGNLISGNTGGGVDVSGSANTVVAGNLIGTDVTGLLALGNRNYGVQVENGASGTTIGGTTASGRNVISGNVSSVGGHGVFIRETAGSTVVQGNFIGTNRDGTAALGNSTFGVEVRANQVTIGGTASGAGNVISGNGGRADTGFGIFVNAVATAGVTIQGNILGTNAAGTAALGNQGFGVFLDGSNGVTVGGTAAVAGNVISGNASAGVSIRSGSNNLVAGNLIGTDVSGTSAVANGTAGNGGSSAGVAELLSSNLEIFANTISGNNSDGILLRAGSNIAIQSNTIGLNQAGTAALGNAGSGIHSEAFDNLAGHNLVTELTIGGSNLGNVTSANKGSGIYLTGTKGATIPGNFIGTNAAGTAALGNSGNGILLGADDSSVTIGGTTAAQRNIISGNKGNGVSLLSSSATVQGNFIGLGQDGTTSIGNNGAGVLLASSGNTVGAGNIISGNFMGVRIGSNNNLVTGNFIGTTADGLATAGNGSGIFMDKGSGNTVQSNVISGNRRDGVSMTLQTKTKLLGNTIGLNAPGTAALANGETGVTIIAGSGNVVGEIGNGNVISGNTLEGVLVTNSASGTSLQANSIGTTKDGKSAIGNGTAGVVVSVLAKNTTVGGTAEGAGNLISGNDAAGADGVLVKNNASGTLLQGNIIGLDKDGTGPLANLHGVVIQDAVNTTVGGSTAGAGNLISSNTLSGINLTGAGFGTLIQGNTIGLDKNGAAAPNLEDGINVQGGSGTTIGGFEPGAGNVVSGNNGNGIAFSGPAVTLIDDVIGNLIGTDASGTEARGNGMAGVLVDDLTAQEHFLRIQNNTISGNAQEGVFITDSDKVSVGGNVIGLNKLGTVALANGTSGQFDGLHVTDSSGVTIGGSSAAENVIAGNTRDGIRVDGGSTGTLITTNTIGLLKGAAQVQANDGNGINITDKASDTTIGGTNGLGTNVISGNALNGVNIDVNTVNITLNDNIIGMDGTASVGLGNQQDGVQILGKGVVLSGILNDFGNWIAGNGGNGILVSGANTSGTVIHGARIGTTGSGAHKVPNALDGILVTTGADDVEIGGPDHQDGNLVSGNTENGIEVTNAAGTLIQRNLVGTDVSGVSDLGNTLDGVFLQGTDSVTVGGDKDTFKNIVSANGKNGIEVKDATNTTIGFDKIGDSFGIPLSNGGDGIFVTGASSTTTVNGNTITANTGAGVNFGGIATGLTLTGNLIGSTFISGAHNKTGVLVNGQDVTIGGTAAGQGNQIFGSTTAGIDVEATAVNVTIQGNFIGTNKSGFTTIGNGTDGILVNGLAREVIIGGTAAEARNVISGNKGNGIHLTNVTQTVKIVGNLVGTDASGGRALKNAQDGLLLEGTSSAVIQGNTISGNGSHGVEVVNGSSGNVIAANKIGVGVGGATALGNMGFGVWVHQGTGAASNANTIGGTATGAGNVIGYNAKGVVIGDSLTDSSHGDAILGNSIFKSSILIDLGNLGVPYTPTGTSGPNLLEVPPTLTSATVSGSNLTVTGSLKGTLASTMYRIEIFAADPTVGPFKRFLGFVNVTTDGSGNVVGGFSVTFQGVAVPKGTAISATATDANSNTAGFATAITAS